jgi:hypothetical protein
MDGFIALALFAKQLSESQKKLSSTQRKQDWPSSDGDDVAPPTIQNSAMEASRCRVQIAENQTEFLPYCFPARED